MYYRSNRNLDLAQHRTDEILGPGSYEIAGRFKPQRKNFAPFASLADRNVFNMNSNAPGPGYYDTTHNEGLDIEKLGNRGGTSLRSTVKRFAQQKKSVPSPTTYNVKGTFDKKFQLEGLDLASFSHLKKNKEKLNKKKIKFVRKFEAPSIPHPRLAYGYMEEADGELQPQEAAEENKKTDFYDIGDIKRTTDQYKGIRFGNRTSDRFSTLFGNANLDGEAPGPGHYSPYGERVQKENINVRQVESDESSKKPLERFTEKVVSNALKESIPPPGAYELRSDFPIANKKNNLLTKIPFGTSSKRFNTDVNENPAPGSYVDMKSYYESFRKNKNLKSVPFNQTDTRFKKSLSSSSLYRPSPCEYNQLSFTDENLKKAFLEFGRKPPFMSTVPRQCFSRNKLEVPGPGSHFIDDSFLRKHEVIKKKKSAVFESVVPRLEDKPKVSLEKKQSLALASDVEFLGPGLYDVANAYNALNDGVLKSSMKRLRKMKRSKTFVIEHDNRKKKSEEKLPEFLRTQTDIPAPNLYNLTNNSKKKVIGGNLSKSTRFQEPITDVPGPGHYQLPNELSDTMIKKTFNITYDGNIAANIAKSKIQTKPAKMNI
ncbi:hypothetical protein SNEBB_009719 [Seison nebaliae]|nr:hypothetical protein SNEBB_009719 [Seison nebaliae]